MYHFKWTKVSSFYQTLKFIDFIMELTIEHLAIRSYPSMKGIKEIAKFPMILEASQSDKLCSWIFVHTISMMTSSDMFWYNSFMYTSWTFDVYIYFNLRLLRSKKFLFFYIICSGSAWLKIHVKFSFHSFLWITAAFRIFRSYSVFFLKCICYFHLRFFLTG